MPFAPISNPDLAGEYMARGISQAGQGIASGLANVITGFKDKAKERKTYLGMADSMASAGEISEVERAAMNNWDTDHIKGYVDGKKVAATLAKLKQEGAEAKARASLYQQQADTARDELTNAALQPEFMTAMERYLSPTGGYEAAVQTPEGRAGMIAGNVSPQALSPLAAISRAAADTKYRIRPNQLDDILRAAASSRTTQIPEGFTPSKIVSGGVTYEPPAPPITAPPGFNPTQIVIGEDGKPRVTLEPTAAPVAIPSGMQPRSMTVDAKGKPTVTYAEPDAAKKLAASYPWLLDDDLEKFKAGLRTIQDPAERNAVIATRSHYEQAINRLSPEEATLKAFSAWSGARTEGTNAPPASSPVSNVPAKSPAATTDKTKVPASPVLKPPVGKVRVIRADGHIGLIPADQLEQALKEGYRQLD